MDRTPTQTREEGVRRGVDDQQAVRVYRTECRREGERLLAWYRHAMGARSYAQQRQVVEVAARNTNYLLPTLRELITVAERELAELRLVPQVPAVRLVRQERYVAGLQSLWEILVEAMV